MHHVTKHVAIFRYGKLDICMCNFFSFSRCYLVFFHAVVLQKPHLICSICISMHYLHLFIDNELRYRVLLLMSRETHWVMAGMFYQQQMNRKEDSAISNHYNTAILETRMSNFIGIDFILTNQLNFVPFKDCPSWR